MSAASARILLVEDDPATALLAQRHLERAGHAVSTAQTPAAAMECLRRSQFDLILLDNRLPEESGLELYQQIKACGFDLPAILMTGFTNEQTVIAALRAGMRDFIPKGPEFVDYLPEAVERVLRQVGTEQRLEGFEKRLAGIIGAATDGILGFERDGKIIVFNPAAEQMFGYRASEAVGQSVERLFPKGISALRPGPANPRPPRRVELVARRADGETFEVDAACFEVEFAGNPFTTLIVSDTSERKRAEQEREKLSQERAARAEAEAASKAKDMFLATLSHELRTPLTTILGWVRMLRSGQLSLEQGARALETIERNVELQAALIEDLLDVSRIVSGNLKLDRQSFDLGALAKEFIEAARPQAAAKDIALEVGIPATPVFVEGDRMRMKQVLSNLLVNAFKFTPAGGCVTMGLEQDGATARLFVADTGKGIAADLLPRIFEPFDQGDREQHGLGLGLGLSIVRHLVEAHGGRVDAHSDGPGRGARFTVEIPARTGPARGASDGARGALKPPTKESTALAGLRVLLVDDDSDSRDLVHFVLAGKGAEVRSAGSVAEALATLRDFRADAVVTDVAMPGGDGYELLSALRGLKDTLGDVPAFAFTAHASKHDRQRALAAGFEGYVSKPVDPFELVEMVSKVRPSRDMTP